MKHMEKDILLDLYKGEITEKNAHKIFNEAVDNFHNAKGKDDPYKLTGFDKFERTAHCLFCSFSVIAKWRYEGWPLNCAECGKKIIKEKFGWRCKIINGKEYLTHIECSKKYLKGIGYSENDLKIN